MSGKDWAWGVGVRRASWVTLGAARTGQVGQRPHQLIIIHSEPSLPSLPLLHGVYQVNPPFEPATLEAAAGRCNAACAAAAAKGAPLAIAFVCPAWREGGAWSALTGSPWLARAFVVAAADHGFCDGAAHQRRDPYRQSPFDTGVFLMHTPAAARKARPGGLDGLEAGVRAGFAAACPTPAAAARQRASRGERDREHWGLGPAAPGVGGGGAKALNKATPRGTKGKAPGTKGKAPGKKGKAPGKKGKASPAPGLAAKPASAPATAASDTVGTEAAPIAHRPGPPNKRKAPAKEGRGGKTGKPGARAGAGAGA